MAGLFGIPTVILSSVGGIEIDAVLNETHKFDTLVTENPIEDGSAITDHIVNLPFILEMQGRFTDTPFNFLQVIASSTVGLAAQLTVGEIAAGLTAAATAALLGEQRPGLAKTKFQLLVALQSTRDVISVVTGLTTYENMVLESLSAPRAEQDGQSLRFTASFREIKIAGATITSNREKIVSDLWSRTVDPRALGILQKAEAAFNPLAIG